MENYSQDNLAAAFAEHRQRLFALAERRLNPILLKRLNAEDVLSETYVNAAKRLEYFASHDDVPVYYKLRTILLQTITDIERRHLKAGRGSHAFQQGRPRPARHGAPSGAGGVGGSGGAFPGRRDDQGVHRGDQQDARAPPRDPALASPRPPSRLHPAVPTDSHAGRSAAQGVSVNGG